MPPISRDTSGMSDYSDLNFDLLNHPGLAKERVALRMVFFGVHPLSTLGRPLLHESWLFAFPKKWAAFSSRMRVAIPCSEAIAHSISAASSNRLRSTSVFP